MVELFEPAELDVQTNSEKYELGRILHCVTRDQANRTDPLLPPTVSLVDYEERVFRPRKKNPIPLDVSLRALKGYFRGRTNYCQRDLVKEYLRETKRKTTDTGLEDRVQSPSSAYSQPVFLNSSEGQYLFEVRNMPNRKWRTIWQTVNLLLVSGLAENTEHAYNLIINKGWPPTSDRAYLRTCVKRGNMYIRVAVTDKDSLWQATDLHSLYVREGFAAVVPLAISDAGDQRMFLETFGDPL
jgi:hypothetical protein